MVIVDPILRRERLGGEGGLTKEGAQSAIRIDLREVTLVEWSYGGAVTTGTCDRVPDRIQSMI